MKKYSEYLAEQYEPLTAEEWKFWFEASEHGMDATNEGLNQLVDEIAYLRSVLAECYMWMGRKVHSGSVTKKYQWAMREAYRIRQEDKE
tara:strand:- start:12345 stop:12611 length:267 start_codon:yes stop_codon:yes gene_type:complete